MISLPKLRTFTPKPGKCALCKNRLEKVGQKLHEGCVDLWVKRQLAKQEATRKKKRAEAAKVERVQTRARKAALERIPDLIEACQRVFNAYIRERDRDKGCFVCGKPFPVGRLGGDFDAGHVRSRGAASHRRGGSLAAVRDR